MQGIVTPDDVRGLWSHMQAEFGTSIVPKEDAVEMDLIAELLDRMGITDKKAFLERFSTTLDDNIYLPFTVGVPGARGRHSLWGQIKVCVHEHQHVVQARKVGLMEFALRYGASGGDRAFYEGEAYRCNMELELWRGNRNQTIARYMESLEHYGLSVSDRVVARSYLTSAKVSVEAGIIQNKATRVALTWLNANAPHIRYAR